MGKLSIDWHQFSIQIAVYSQQLLLAVRETQVTSVELSIKTTTTKAD